MVLRTIASCLVFVALLGTANSRAIELSSSDLDQLRAARTGQALVLQLATNRQAIPHLPVNVTAQSGTQFLFSDKPEYFPKDGIALREKVNPGIVRLYVYHVPEPVEAGKVITTAIENLGTQDLKIKMLRRGFPRPGGDYHRVAKDALTAFLTSRPEESSRSITPGGALIIDPEMDKIVARKDQLVHGFYEFTLDGPARVTVFQRDPSADSLAALKTLEPLAARRAGHEGASGAGRGLFLSPDYEVKPAMQPVDTAAGAMQIVIADGKRDPWMRGHDGIENRAALNAGNYGAIYRIRFTRTSSDGCKLALLFTKLDVVNQWCGAVAAAVTLKRGNQPEELIAVPADKVALQKKGEVSVLAVFPPLPAGETEDIELVYSPPGAACLPTPLLLVPFK